MTGYKTYFLPPGMVLNGIHDLAGLQKAETLVSDATRGLVRLKVSLTGEEREYKFIVEEADSGRCRVRAELAGGGQYAERLIQREFALLDYVLEDRTKAELMDMEEYDRRHFPTGGGSTDGIEKK